MLRRKNIALGHALGALLALTLAVPASSAPMRFKVIYNFKFIEQGRGQVDGDFPRGPLTEDANGNIYGTTSLGGQELESGAIFRLAPDGAETVLYSFEGETSRPVAGVTLDSFGNMYGTTTQQSAIFKIAPDGAETDFEMPSTYAAEPLLADKAGNIYGTSQGGGAGASCTISGGCGTVFKIAPDGTQKVLHAFCSRAACADGSSPAPQSGLTMDSDVNLYGTTASGGTGGCFDQGGCGVVFKLSPEGSETVLYAFKGMGDGRYPSAAPLRDSKGFLYGTTSYGGGTGCGGNGCGTAYALAPDGTETLLHVFNATVDGAYPTAGLVRDKAGNLYGTTDNYGCWNASNCGTAFMLTPDGAETILHTFTMNDGGFPSGGLYMDKHGNLFGTMSGVTQNEEYTAANGSQFGAVFELQK